MDGLAARAGGAYRFLVEEMRGLAAVRPDIDTTILASPWNVNQLRKDLGGYVRLIRLKHPAARYAFQQTKLPAMARLHDVLYCPGNFAPLIPHRTPTVVTVQDLSYFTSSGEGSPGDQPRGWYRTQLCRASVRRADRVVAISGSLGAAIVNHVPAAADKLNVIHSGAPVWPDTSHPVPGVESPFVLSVANGLPHKHLDVVVRGWALAVAAQDLSTQLVLVGRVSDSDVLTHREMAGAAVAHLVHLGPVTDRSQLRWLYEQASVLVTMSTLEAYPLTPGEAGSLGCPIIVSDIPAHREVAGAHAQYIVPGDTHTLGAALVETIIRRERHERRWTPTFSWADHACKLGDILDDVA